MNYVMTNRTSINVKIGSVSQSDLFYHKSCIALQVELYWQLQKQLQKWPIIALFVYMLISVLLVKFVLFNSFHLAYPYFLEIA